MKLSELATKLGAELIGDAECEISGINGITEASIGQITFLGNPKYESAVATSKASAIIVPETYNAQTNQNFLKVKDPSYSFSKAVMLIVGNPEKHNLGIHPDSCVSSSAVLGKNVSIGAYAVIESGVKIEDNVIIYPNTYIGKNSYIGEGTLIYPNVTVYYGTNIGKRCIIHSGTVVGSDGFGFATINGKHEKIPQLGIVIIEDDVEIGANCTIDRARFDRTIIRSGTKLDNLVQVAHNVEVGKNCFMVAQSGIAGSSKMGSNVIIAGQVGIAGHIEIGDNVLVGAQSGVSKSLPGNSKYWGTPAQPMKTEMQEKAYVARLPELTKKIKELEKELQELKNKLNG